MLDGLSVERLELVPDPVDEGPEEPDSLPSLLPTLRTVLSSACRTAGLTTLQLQVPGVPSLSVQVRGPAQRGLRLLAAWPVQVAPDDWHDGLLLVATAPDADPARRAAVAEAALLVGELLAADHRRTRAETVASEAIELAGVDPLTELGNRRTWRRALDLEAARSARGAAPCSVVVVDLDGLKRINDLQGHAAGDAHLQRAGSAVQAASRSVDVVCRLGGDEFGLLAPATDADGAQHLARRLRGQLRAAGVEASIGRATAAGGDLDEAWQRADTAMYVEKRARR